MGAVWGSLLEVPPFNEENVVGSTECLSREYSQIQGSPGPWIHHRSSTCVHEGIPTFPAWSHPPEPLRALHKQGICHQFQKINLECQTLARTLDQHHCLELGCCGNFPGFWVFSGKQRELSRSSDSQAMTAH